MNESDDLFQLSGIQHFAFCPRQWALIHIEKQWAENGRTVDGEIFHDRVHDAEKSESRGDLLIVRGMRILSNKLGICGQCDVVEFHRLESGISLYGCEGKWLPYPIEYKKGKPKENQADELQLCCQAMCLEEMLACDIPEGSLFYGEPKRRSRVALDTGLRETAVSMLRQMQEYYSRGYTPRPKPAKRCHACSLVNLCLPKLCHSPPVKDYLKAAMKENSYEAPA